MSTEALERPVYADGAYKPFGSFTVAEVRARAQELRAVTGFGPTSRVAGVARGWAELASTLERSGVSQVRELDTQVAEEFARRLWVVPPGGSLL